jgi:outer membrane receptor for ferric coprogen and ferric-rhodotorulic acid
MPACASDPDAAHRRCVPPSLRDIRLMTSPLPRPAGTRFAAASLLLSIVSLFAAPSAALASPEEEAPADRDARTLDRLQVTARRPEGYGAEVTGTATRLPLTPRETPQSITVVTRDRMEDFGLTDINGVLDAATGVNVERVETDRTYYTARGFDITNFQIDGLGLPFAYGLQNGDIDTAFYDRIEVLRGANGLLSSTGNPSATVNFVRKRPQHAFGGHVGARVGSWNERRVDADVSLPFDAAGAVRSRFVLAAEDGDSHLDRYHHAKQLGYGVIEADLGESATVAFGLQQQRNEADGTLWGALPLYYSDGTPTRYDRYTSTSARWTYWDTRDTRAFAEVGWRFAGDWQLKASLNYREDAAEEKLFYIYGTPERDTGLGLLSYPAQFIDYNHEYHTDIHLTGPLHLGGAEHDLVVGLNGGRRITREDSAYPTAQIGLPLPPLEDWTGDFPEPAFPAPVRSADFTATRASAYALVRWRLGDATKLITGLNHTRIRSEGQSYGAEQAYRLTRNSPYVGVVQDVGRQLSLYASYAGIFNPQVELDASGAVLDPIEGSNFEAGIKGEWLDGKLDASAAVFRVEQDNTAEALPFDPALGGTRYVGVDATSRGYELEVSGRPAAGWNLAAGYTHLSIRGEDGQAVRTYVPRSMFRLSTVYRIPRTDGLRIGGYLRWQDAIERSPPDAVSTITGEPIVIRQDAYTVVGLMAGYDFADGWRATLNLDNVTDRRYIASLYWDQGYYAAPRSVSLSLDYRF